MSSVPVEQCGAFVYRAQTAQGEAIRGTIEALNADEARFRLASLNLRVFEIQPATDSAKPQRLKGEDFASFNQQLAQLTSAGMPLERGLRLIAQDMRRGRLSRAVHAVANELERGTPLSDAFALHSRSFPALYGKVLEAGVKAGNLPGILLNLGRHMDLMQQLRRSLWRAAAYPMMALAATMLLLVFIGYMIVTPFQQIFGDFDTELPTVTKLVFMFTAVVPYIVGIIVGLISLVLLTWTSARASGREQAFLDAYVMPLPLIGAVLRSNLTARWCDAVGMAVEGGMDLPQAMELAAESTASPALTRDTRKLIESHNNGKPMETSGKMEVLTPTVHAAIDLGRQRGDLGNMLSNLTGVYTGRSEHALGVAIAALSPLFLVVVASLLAFIVAGLFMPLVKLIQNVSK